MTRIIGSVVSLIDSIQIDDNIPLPSKRQKEEKRYVETATAVPATQPVKAALNDPLLTRKHLTPGHLKWRSSICRYKRNERVF